MFLDELANNNNYKSYHKVRTNAAVANVGAKFAC